MQVTRLGDHQRIIRKKKAVTGQRKRKAGAQQVTARKLEESEHDQMDPWGA